MLVNIYYIFISYGVLVKTSDCLNYLETLLKSKSIKDYAPNGLQISGKSEIKTLITGVTANEALIDAAINEKADAILVHHGFFFKGEEAVITGMKRNRIAKLLAQDINLIAYHLPLDFHPVFGNNVALAAILDIEVEGTFSSGPWQQAGCFGSFKKDLTPEELEKCIHQKLLRRPLHIGGSQKRIRTVAWATGAAQDYIVEASRLGVDAYITGEASERTCHYARELNIHFFSAGHHATERYGVKNLGSHLADKFKIKHKFIDIENPI
ncbi:MAG: Nif3-like dinuclear metal center hexameric protein [Zetaproteobacteria bacterium]|nr:Nif3-like dinuclear metal center hexameric protein [Pseudobdellovibrionaceae bacterium]